MIAKIAMGVTSGPSTCTWTLQLGSVAFALQKALAPVDEMKLTALHPPIHMSQVAPVTPTFMSTR